VGDTFEQAKSELLRVAESLHARGWLLGTSGNLSCVVEREPLRLAITPSGADKGELSTSEILSIDDQCKSQDSSPGKPSDESPLHVAIAKFRNAGAVIHTHSVWSTLLSDVHEDIIEIEGFEMLKGLDGVTTHEHREWIPILENSQNMSSLAETMREVLATYPAAHAVLLRRHGLYTWGRNLKEAKRHVEILEFLFEVLGRRMTRS
jgi:methylthioribulose-1-phosphate dehydratase